MTHARPPAPAKRGPKIVTVHDTALTMLRAYLAERGLDGSERWPDARYRDDPVAFCREVLGVPVWGDDSTGMRAMALAVRDSRRTAVRAGRKVSKSFIAAAIALWWFCVYDDAEVTLTSTTDRQVNGILWKAVRYLHARSQRPIDPRGDVDAALLRFDPSLRTRPIDGHPAQLARSGLVSGYRAIRGYTAREGVAAQGTSGVHQLYIVDEASGVSQAVIDAILGNMAGGAPKLVLFGNPTKAEGEFYDAFNSKAMRDDNPTGYRGLTIPSTSSPNVGRGYDPRDDAIPGLANDQFLLERRIEWGEDSPLYKVHVLGQHVEIEEGKIVSLQVIADAQERYAATGVDAVPAEGVLHVGIDPALAASGDEAVMIARRGRRVVDIRASRGLDEDGHVAMLDDLLREHRTPGEVAVVNLDALGDVGAKVKVAMTIYWRAHENAMVLVSLRGSDNALRDPAGYIRVRDELWGNVAEWLRDGAIPEHVKLERDLHAPSWIPGDLKQRKQAQKKDQLRRMLGRSPDYGDALALAVWDGARAVAAWTATVAAPPRGGPSREPAASGIDPYASEAAWHA